MSFERIKDTHRHQMVTITPRKKAMRSRLSFKIGFIAVLSLWFCIHMSIFQTPFYSEKISPKHFHQPSQKRLEKRLEFVHITLYDSSNLTYGTYIHPHHRVIKKQKRSSPSCPLPQTTSQSPKQN